MIKPLYAIPTCNPTRAKKVTQAWRDQGYQVALIVDHKKTGQFLWGDESADLVIEMRRYLGYYESINMLNRFFREGLLPQKNVVSVFNVATLERPEVVVTGGDDIYPDPTMSGPAIVEEMQTKNPDGFWVMQPIGDMVAMPGTERICGSPWFGPAWQRRAYQGNGPFCGAYFQFYGDEELFEVSKKLGVLIQREDLTQRHDHYHRNGGPKKTDYQEFNENHFWKSDRETFLKRKKRGWPDHVPLAS